MSGIEVILNETTPLQIATTRATAPAAETVTDTRITNNFSNYHNIDNTTDTAVFIQPNTNNLLCDNVQNTKATSYVNRSRSNRYNISKPSSSSSSSTVPLNSSPHNTITSHSKNNNYISIRNMDTNQQQILRKVIIDIAILMCVGFPILFFFLFGQPFERGFFCDDESLKHPFHDSTVKNWMLYIIGLVLPIGIILTTEYIKDKLHNNKKSSKTYKFLEWNVPSVFVEWYKQIGIFGFGAAISQLVTDIAKYSIGRLRPHFFDVCQPIFKDRTNCSDPKNLGIYHVNFDCTNPLATARMKKEMRLSFPSGHSSFSVFTMIYCAIYLQSRMTWRDSKLLKHFLQFFLIMLAWGTALSRVSNYKHHWSDVLSGGLIGAICALVVANYISDLCCPDQKNKTVLPITSSSQETINRHAENNTGTSQQSTNGRIQ